MTLLEMHSIGQLEFITQQSYYQFTITIIVCDLACSYSTHVFYI